MTDQTKPAVIPFVADGENGTSSSRVDRSHLSLLDDGRKEPSAEFEGDDPDDDDQGWNDDDGQDDVVQSKPKKAKKGKGMSPNIIIGIALGALLFVIAIGVVIVQKKRAAAQQGDSMETVGPQPQIVQPAPIQQPAPQPMQQQASVTRADAGANDMISPSANGVQTPQQPATQQAAHQPEIVVPHSAPVVAAPAPNPVPPPAPQAAPVQSAPAPAVVAAPAAATTSVNDAMVKDVAAIREAMVQMMRRIDRIEQQQLAMQRTAKPTVVSAPAVVTQPAKPVVTKPAVVKAPVRQAPIGPARPSEVAPRKMVDEKIIDPAPPMREYWVSGIVNDRAFIVRRNPDGSESEQSVVVGDRLEKGGRVLAINARDKIISIEGGQQIAPRR